MQNINKMITAKIRKLKTCQIQMEYFFKKDFLKAYFLIHFNCGLVPYHHIKCKPE